MSRVALAVACLALAQPALAEDLACRTRPDVSGACSEVSGTIRLFDGTPSARLFVSGTRHVLGIKPYITDKNETFVAPLAVRDQANFDRPFKGRFLVCPLGHSRPGAMPSVCVEALLLPATSRR